jgi:hypothetical protein
MAAVTSIHTKGDDMATTKSAMASGDSMSATAGEMRDELQDLDQRLRLFVKERPIMALLSAVAAGYMVGRILRRHA